jgi:hypothetical protein
MQQYSVFMLSCCLFLSLTMSAAGEEKIIVPATLRSVTVYRSGAELVHTASARLEQGSNEVIIGEVSNAIDETSIRIGCSASVTIISITFSTDYLQNSLYRIKKRYSPMRSPSGTIKKKRFPCY